MPGALTTICPKRRSKACRAAGSVTAKSFDGVGVGLFAGDEQAAEPGPPVLGETFADLFGGAGHDRTASLTRCSEAEAAALAMRSSAHENRASVSKIAGVHIS